MSTISNDNIKVFYDGKCPLCRREIKHYQTMRGAETIDWIDITHCDIKLDSYGLTFDQAMARLHVLDSRGQWQTGAYAFATMWNQLVALRWVAVTLRTIHCLPTIDWVYNHFARRRLQNRCKSGQCQKITTDTS